MEVMPSSPAPKRARVARPKSASADIETPKTTAKKPATRKKKVPAKDASHDMGGMIATAAYYLAERRNFTPGHEVEDWLEAERQIKAMLG